MLIQEIVECVILQLTDSVLLADDAETLRDIALKYEAQDSITGEEALALLKLAHRAT